MSRKLSLSALERKLDNVFSVWVRRRAADEGGTVACVTCGKLGFWEKDGMQAGHFIKRQHRSCRWRPSNVHPQCVRCNLRLNGNEAEYSKFIIQCYGLAEFNDLMQAKHVPTKFTRADLERMIEEFSAKVKALDLREAA